MIISAQTARRREARTEKPFKVAMRQIVYATGDGHKYCHVNELNKYALNKLTKLGYKVKTGEHTNKISWQK